MQALPTRNQDGVPRRLLLPGIAFAAALALAGSTFGPAAERAAAAAPAAAVPSDSLSEHAGAVDGMVLDAHGEMIVNDLERTQIAPGLVHYEYERLSGEGRQPVNILKAELGEETVRLKYLAPDTISGDGATVTELTDDAGAVAGVNLQFFDINNSNASGGWGITDGELLKSGDPGADQVIATGADGLARLVSLTLKGSAAFDGGATVPISRLNTAHASSGEVVLYNAAWGAFDRGTFLGTAAGIEVRVGADGAVTSVGAPGEGQLADGESALIAASASANGALLAQTTVGQKATVTYDFDRSMGDLSEAGGIWHELIRHGEPVPFGSGSHFTTRHPRTMLGISQDGRTVYYVVVDGRSTGALGMTFAEQIALMGDLGAYDAVSVDGGGSSQMNVREPGDTASTVQNSPSDGIERHDGDGIGLVLAKPGSGRAAAIAVEPTVVAADANRVFPGLHRTLDAAPYDESGTAVADDVAWHAETGHVGVETVDGDTVVVEGRQPGTATLVARDRDARGHHDILVLDDLQRVESSSSLVALSGEGASSKLLLTGVDENGFTAPIEAADVTVTGNDDSLLSIEPDPSGTFTLEALKAAGSQQVHFEVDGEKVDVAVTVGLQAVSITDLSNAASWTSANDRAPGGTVSASTDDTGAPAVRVTYDFTRSTSTRGQYAVAPGSSLPVPGQPQKLRLRVNGDGNGAWLRIQVQNADRATTNLDGPMIDWRGWKTVEITVPAGFRYPITMNRVRFLETAAAKQYKGEVAFSQIEALVAQPVELPALPLVEDHEVVRPAGTTDAAPQRIALVSDAQFVARAPESGQVQGVKQALAEIVAAKPDAMFIVGDLVDEASPADFALAAQILDEGLKDAEFPWYYVPGNHEIMGGSIQNFRDAALGGFGGATHGHVDIEGTRFITLNTADGTLWRDFDQMQMLREQLDGATTDPSVTGVVIVQHMPIDDPNTNKVSQLGDRRDAALETEWIEEFRERSGKSIAVVSGHVGDFHAKTVDGIPYLINGNSGKAPTQAEQGAFLGWTMLGIDPAAGVWNTRDREVIDDNSAWFMAETRVRAVTVALDDLDGPVAAGTSVALEGAVQQNESESAPLAWPMSVGVRGSESVFVGAAADAPRRAVAAIDPATLTLTALRAGSGSVTVTVSGQEDTVEFDVTAQ